MSVVYCDRWHCPFEDCELHSNNAPRGVAHTECTRSCDRYDEFLERLKAINGGRACNIINNIRADDETTKAEKLEAIRHVLEMRDKKCVSRQMLYGVVEYLLDLCWDWKMQKYENEKGG